VAIALDVKTSATGSGATLSWSHTCTGSNLALVVDVGSYDGASGNRVSTVTYNGVALTRLAEVTGAAFDNSSLWGLKNPATGANTITVTFVGTVGSAIGGGQSFTGVDQTTPFGTGVTASGASGEPTVDVTGTTTGNIVVDSWAEGAGTILTETGTLHHALAIAGESGGSQRKASSGGTITMNWTGATSTWAIVAAEVFATAVVANAALPIIRIANKYVGPQAMRFFYRQPTPRFGTGSAGPSTFTQALSGGLSFVGSFSRVGIFLRVLAGVLSFIGNWTRVATVLRTLTGGLSFTGTWSRAATMLRPLAATLSFTGAFAVGKAYFRSLAGVLSFTGTWTRAATFARSLTGGLTFAGSIIKNPKKVLTAALSFAGTLTKKRAIVFRASSNTDLTNGATTITVTKPTGVVDGDVLIATITANDSPPHATLTGWTEVDFTPGVFNRFTTLRRIASSEGASFVFSGPTNGVVDAFVSAYSGVDNATPIDVTPASSIGTTTSVTAPSITTVSDNAWHIGVFASDVNGTTLTLPTGYTNDVPTFGSVGRVMRVDHKLITPAGATGSATSTTDVAGGWFALSIALRPASFPFAQALAGVLSFAGSWSRVGIFQRTQTAVLSFTGTHTGIKIFLRAFAGVLSFTGTWSRVGTFLRSFPSVLTFTGTWTRSATILRSLAGTLSFSGAFSAGKAYFRNMAGVLSFTGTFSRLRQFFRTFTAALPLIGNITVQRVGLPIVYVKNFVASLSFTGTHTIQRYIQFYQQVREFLFSTVKIRGKGWMDDLTINKSYLVMRSRIVGPQELAYKAGTAIIIETTFTDSNGGLIDPDVGTAKLYVKNPTGGYVAGFVRAVSGGAMTKISLGVWQYTYQTTVGDAAGGWTFETEGKIGTITSIDDVKIQIKT